MRTHTCINIAIGVQGHGLTMRRMPKSRQQKL